MATWSKSTRTTHEMVYTIPVNEPWGATWNEVMSALNMAHDDYVRTYDKQPSDDAIRVHIADDEITIVYEMTGSSTWPIW